MWLPVNIIFENLHESLLCLQCKKLVISYKRRSPILHPRRTTKHSRTFYSLANWWKCIAMLTEIYLCERVECQQSITNAWAILVVLKNQKHVPLHFVLWRNLVLSCCAVPDSIFCVILRSRSITAQVLIYSDGLIFSLPFRDHNYKQIHRWTFVNVCSRHAPRECSLAMRQSSRTWTMGTEYWLLESSIGHTINRGGYHFSEYSHHFIHLSCSSNEFGEILNLVNAFPFRQIDYCVW